MEKKKLPAKIFRQEVIVFLVVVALFAFFCAASQDFRKYATILDILDKSYFVLLMAIGVAFPLITGGVDLSIGTGLVCYSLAGGYLIMFKGWSTGPAMIITILFGIAIGVLNGILIGVMNLPPFLGTLCTCMITRGLGSICSKNTGIVWPTTGQPGSWFRKIFKYTTSGGTNIPLGLVWIILLVLIMHFVLNHTKVGRYTIAIGSNKEAAILSGINVKFYHVMAYAISGLFSAFAAIAYAGIFQTIYPGSGAGFELEAIGGAIIGGVSATGGAGSIIGTFLGVYVICLLKTGLPLIGLQAKWQQIVTGLVLIGSVMVDIIKKKKEAKK